MTRSVWAWDSDISCQARYTTGTYSLHWDGKMEVIVDMELQAHQIYLCLYRSTSGPGSKALSLQILLYLSISPLSLSLSHSFATQQFYYSPNHTTHFFSFSLSFSVQLVVVVSPTPYPHSVAIQKLNSISGWVIISSGATAPCVRPQTSWCLLSTADNPSVPLCVLFAVLAGGSFRGLCEQTWELGDYASTQGLWFVIVNGRYEKQRNHLKHGIAISTDELAEFPAFLEWHL